MKFTTKLTAKLFLVIAILSSSAFADGDMGSGGKTCGDMGSGGKTCPVPPVGGFGANQSPDQNDDDSILTTVIEYLATLFGDLS